MSRHVFADGPSNPAARYSSRKKTVANAVAAVAHAVQLHPAPGLSLAASAGNVTLRARNKGSSTMVVPFRRHLRIKTPPSAQRAPSMGAVRTRERLKGPLPTSCSTVLCFTSAITFYSTTPRMRQGTSRLHSRPGGSFGGGEDGGDSGNPDEDAPLGTNEDPDSSGGDDAQGFRGPKCASMSINKWARPIPKLAFTPTHSSSKGKQD